MSTVYLCSLVVLRGPRMDAGYAIFSGLVDLAGIAWTFWVGSAIGSFLNVVAWRLPRGRSVGGRSHCPYCESAILPRDNVPVFGWLALRGRCRNCHLPISSRYPIVELAVGISLMTVGLTVLYRGQGYLPLGEAYRGSNWPLRLAELGWQEYTAMAYYFYSLAGLWALGLVRIDGFRLPIKLVLSVGIIVVGLPIAMPFLQPLPWQFAIPLDDQAKYWRGDQVLDVAMYEICAFACGTFLARLAGRFLFPKADLKLDPLSKDSGSLVDLSLGWSLASMIIGWPSMLGIFSLVILLANLLRRWLPSRNIAGRILLATPVMIVAVIIFWPSLVKQSWWPSPGHSPILYLIYAVSGWIIAWMLQEAHEIAPSPMTHDACEEGEDLIEYSGAQEDQRPLS